eukprot:gene4611-5647_t
MRRIRRRKHIRVDRALEKAKTVGQKVLIVRIHSTGGSVPAGNLIRNRLKEYQKQHGGQIVTYVPVLAFSMAAILFLCGDRRVMSHSARLMLHRVSLHETGECSKDVHLIQSVNDYCVNLNTELFEFVVQKSNKRLTSKDLEERTPGIDWYITYKEALDYNLATHVSDVQPRLVAAVRCIIEGPSRSKYN